jgi:hypothetical protein
MCEGAKRPNTSPEIPFRDVGMRYIFDVDNHQFTREEDRVNLHPRLLVYHEGMNTDREIKRDPKD